MSPTLFGSNLASYCLQIALLVAAAAFIPAAVRLAEPRARLAFWHIVLAACLLLPLLAPWHHESITIGPGIAIAHTAPAPRVAPVATRIVPWDEIALAVLAAGALARFAWIAIGLARLRHYRRRSTPLHPRASWAVEADLRLSPDVASPVTFGARHPVVLLPAHFPTLDATTREAILCHEILHVRRNDWLAAIAEEFVRGIFWFHPAIWWLLGEIGLSREQAVDREVVEITRCREEYVDALLAIAGAAPSLDLAPAPLFLRKRHLKHRVVSIMKEVRMSKTRSLSALVASLGFLAAACWLITLSVPLSAAPQMVADGAGVTVDLGNSAVMHRTSITYPPAARVAKLEGTVLVEATLDNAGNVVDARIVSGPNEFRRAVLQSVLQWHFANDSGATTRQIRVTFTTPQLEQFAKIQRPPSQPPNANPSTSEAAPRAPSTDTGTRAGVLSGMIASVPRPSFAGRTVKQIAVFGLTDEAQSRLISRLPVRTGDVLDQEGYTRLVAAVHDYDEHLTVGVSTGKDDNITFSISAPGASPTGIGSAYPATSMGEAPPPANGVKRITIGGNVQSVKLVSQPRPVYPPLAKQARITGVVKLAAIINADGTMKNLQVISGHPLLVAAALDAVRQWTYATTLLNGEPVEVITQIDVNFTLSDGPPPPPQQ